MPLQGGGSIQQEDVEVGVVPSVSRFADDSSHSSSDSRNRGQVTTLKANNDLAAL